MNITQDTFNKIITLILLTSGLIIYILAWILGKPLPSGLFSYLTTLLPAIFVHSTHQLANKFEDKAGSNGNK